MDLQYMTYEGTTRANENRMKKILTGKIIKVRRDNNLNQARGMFKPYYKQAISKS